MASIRRFDPGLTGADVKEFTFHLMNDKWFLPDVLHDYQRMMEEYAHQMSLCLQPFALVDSKNALAGVLFLTVHSPGHEATFYIWLWGRCYTPATKRFMMEYLEHYAEEYGLARIVCKTPDDKGLGRILERLGFKLESRAKHGYKSGGKLTTLYGYRRLFSGGVA